MTLILRVIFLTLFSLLLAKHFVIHQSYLAVTGIIFAILLVNFLVQRYFWFKNVIDKNPIYTPSKPVKVSRRVDDATPQRDKVPEKLIAPRADFRQYLRCVFIITVSRESKKCVRVVSLSCRKNTDFYQGKIVFVKLPFYETVKLVVVYSLFIGCGKFLWLALLLSIFLTYPTFC